VRAQDFILKKGLHGSHHKNSQSTIDVEDIAIGIGNSGPHSNINNFLDDSIGGPSTRSVRGPKVGEDLQLPSISDKKAPFKGFLDISIVSQKLRKSIGSEGRRANNTTGENSTERNADGPIEGKAVMKTRFKKEGAKMSPKVLETWINETLQDAEHLDIPGVILKPEHKNPIARYGIERMVLIEAGITNELVDRIYRALFVYSVGFYELIKKCLDHTDKKYTIITALWKVFSILLEYCCRTDYRMLIQEISQEHKKEIEELETKY
jgi:hypothetical protein